jgi:hypothetical protein
MPNLSTLVTPSSSITADKLSGGQSGSAPIYGCRAWVNFNGTLSAGGLSPSQNNQPVLIRASGNVSRVIKTNTARYTIFFNINLPENYAALAADNASTISNMRFGTNVYTVSSVDVEVYTGDPPVLTSDASTVMCAFIG